jgi:multidrug efflux pump subunit AcrB
VWIVKLALRRPYTFVVMAILMLVLGATAIASMPTDIFPYIDIPVVSVVWAYTGMSPEEMAERIVTVDERAMTTTVNNIEHMESTSYSGTAVIRMFFQPNVKVELAIAQITALSQTILRPLPPGTFAPNIVSYDASSVPILQLALQSDTLGEEELYDYGQNFIRTQLATVQGASIPLPYGGKSRAIMVDIDPAAMYANHVSATDVSNAMNEQSPVLPAGTAKVGDREYVVQMNSSPLTVEGLNQMPLHTINGGQVLIKDVAQVRDGYQVQTNIVRANGRRSALLTILKNGQASTLAIVSAIKEALPNVLASLPKDLHVRQLFDQSLFVRAAINGVLREGAIAAALTGLMILLFLGSWRSTLIVCCSIPLSILTSVIVLSLLNQTINVMTLGGLALAVGILVDDATVEIENIHRNMGMRKPITRAILDGAQQIAVPAFVSTLSICIVFVPVLLLTGAAKFLFTPLAMAVVFAMLTSYLLTRTLVPTMVHYMLKGEAELYQKGEEAHEAEGQGPIWRVHRAFNRRFERLRERYKGGLEWALDHRALVVALFGVFALGSLILAFVVGRDFFPYVDSGQMRLHVRAPEGTRIEETERIFATIEREIRRIIPSAEIDQILDNIGLPNGGVNLAFGDTASIASSDGEILIALNSHKSRGTQEYQRILRADLNRAFPDETFFFQAANITNQILNFGLPMPIDIQIVGRNAAANYQMAREIRQKVEAIPGAVDVLIRQEVATPTVMVNVDRVKANQNGLTQRDVANSMLISLSSSGQVAPNQWLNPTNGVSYPVTVQTPQYRIDSFDALQRIPITPAGGSSTQLLRNLASLQRTTSTTIVNHYNVQPVFDIYANADRRDLGGVADDIGKILDSYRKKLTQGTTIVMRGQVLTMQQSFERLGLGMIFAIMLVYLLMVINFQSWLDPFIILMALPGAIAGILWMLFITQTTLNVPSLMGAIMAIGVATANSILLVVFANDERVEGKNQHEAALSAGFTRMRPVVMTALAMIIGMTPMALALGEGGEQNAPLGRAVIGGLIVATFTTLFFVPIMYSLLRKEAPGDQDRIIEEEAHQGEEKQGEKESQ